MLKLQGRSGSRKLPEKWGKFFPKQSKSKDGEREVGEVSKGPIMKDTMFRSQDFTPRAVQTPWVVFC